MVKTKRATFRHYYESHGSSPIGVTIIYYHKHMLIEGKLRLMLLSSHTCWIPLGLLTIRPMFQNTPKIILFDNAWPTQTHCLNLFIHWTLTLFACCSIPSMQFRQGYLVLWFTGSVQVENWLVQTNDNISTLSNLNETKFNLQLKKWSIHTCDGQ